MASATVLTRLDVKDSSDAIGQAIASALSSTINPSLSSPIVTERKEYEKRLLSFHASSYYAKPACLSPLVCARFGWINADRDMLSCTSCQGALAISLPSGLSAQAMEKICIAYRQQLSTAHQDYCSFRLEAGQHLRRTEEGPLSIIPLALARVFPPDLVRLMDHPSPTTLFREKVQSIEAVCAPSFYKLSDLDVANEIQTFRLHESDETNALDVVVSGCTDLIGTKDKSVVLLALLGWAPMDDNCVETDVESQNVTATFGCPLCFSIMEISLLALQTATSDTLESTTGSRPLKRLKRLARFCNPHDAHRHYCPFICGFPSAVLRAGTPLWQILLKRLHAEQQQKQLHESKSNQEGPGIHDNQEGPGIHDITNSEKVLDPEDAVARIRGILLAGIAPPTVDLDIEDNDDEDDEATEGYEGR